MSSQLLLYQSQCYFFVRSVNFIDNGERTLVIDRQKTHIFELKGPQPLDQTELYMNEKMRISDGPIFGFLGTMNIIGQNYLCVIKDAQKVGQMYGTDIFKITDVRLIPFFMNVIHNVAQYIDELKKYLCDGFYFSYGYDLTASRQRRIKFLQEKSKDMMRIIACDHRYFWNINLYKDFRDQNVDPRWFTPVVQGYAGVTKGKLGNKDISLGLISRRSHLRTGTRFHARGIDDTGNVANFVETEQIVQLDNTVFSYTIIRGSVPVFWEQKGVTENVALTRGPEMTKRAFHKHMEDIISTYGPIYAVDLLSDTTTREIILTKEYIRQIYDCEFKDKIRFLHLDFHAYCKGDKYDQLKIMVSKLDSGLQDFGWFVEDLSARKVLSLQKGAFRVNCLDSLDRTNVAQSKLGLTLLQRQLQKLGFNIEETFGREVAKETIAFIDEGKPVVRQLKTYWAEQGDYLSKQYVGTNSTISKVSRDNKEGFLGKISHKMMNVQRFFINSWGENFSQNSIDIILGKHVQSQFSSEMRNYVEAEMQKRQDDYTDLNQVNLFVGTWNLGGVRPYSTVDISSWLFPIQESFIPDIVVLGFQELAEASLMGGGGNVEKAVKQWNELVLKTLRERTGGGDYVQISNENLGGISIALFTKRQLSSQITDIATSKVKLGGLSTKFGSKGATLIRFLFQDTSFCFINCHLDSGMSLQDSKKRVQQIGEVFSNAFIKERGTSNINYSVYNHQVKVVFGDLNFRIDLDNDTVRKHIASKDYEYLHKYEEFHKFTQLDSEIMRDFKEAPLYFDPTYKYNFNSSEYDTSNKARIPAWCDRIFFEAKESLAGNLQQVLYTRSELKLSTHRPVLGLFEAKIRKINEEKFAVLEEKLIQEFNMLKKEEEAKKALLNPVIIAQQADQLEVLDEVENAESNVSPVPLKSQSSTSSIDVDQKNAKIPVEVTSPSEVKESLVAPKEEVKVQKQPQMQPTPQPVQQQTKPPQAQPVKPTQPQIPQQVPPPQIKQAQPQPNSTQQQVQKPHVEQINKAPQSAPGQTSVQKPVQQQPLFSGDAFKKEESKPRIPEPAQDIEQSIADAEAQLFLPKKFAFKPQGAPSVTNVIKNVGLFNDDEEEEEKKPIVTQPKIAAKIKQNLFASSDEEEDDKKPSEVSKPANQVPQIPPPIQNQPPKRSTAFLLDSDEEEDTFVPQKRPVKQYHPKEPESEQSPVNTEFDKKNDGASSLSKQTDQKEETIVEQSEVKQNTTESKVKEVEVNEEGQTKVEKVEKADIETKNNQEEEEKVKEAQRQKEEEDKQRIIEEEALKLKEKEESERKRQAEEQAQRKKEEEEEADRQKKIEEETIRMKEEQEAQRIKEEEEAERQRQIEEEAAIRVKEALEAQQIKEEEEAERQRQIEEEAIHVKEALEAQRIKEEEEAETQRKMEEEGQRLKEEEDARRLKQEQESQRLKEEEDVERQRVIDEERRQQEEIQRQKELEEERLRQEEQRQREEEERQKAEEEERLRVENELREQELQEQTLRELQEAEAERLRLELEEEARLIQVAEIEAQLQAQLEAEERKIIDEIEQENQRQENDKSKQAEEESQQVEPNIAAADEPITLSNAQDESVPTELIEHQEVKEPVIEDIKEIENHLQEEQKTGNEEVQSEQKEVVDEDVKQEEPTQEPAGAEQEQKSSNNKKKNNKKRKGGK